MTRWSDFAMAETSQECMPLVLAMAPGKTSQVGMGSIRPHLLLQTYQVGKVGGRQIVLDKCFHSGTVGKESMPKGSTGQLDNYIQ